MLETVLIILAAVVALSLLVALGLMVVAYRRVTKLQDEALRTAEKMAGELLTAEDFKPRRIRGRKIVDDDAKMRAPADWFDRPGW